MKVKLYWWMHHAKVIEETVNPSGRRDYIVDNKPPHEVDNRLRAMKPVKRPDLLPLPIRREWKRAQRGESHALTFACQQCNKTTSKFYPQLIRRNRKEYPKVPLELVPARREWDGSRVRQYWKVKGT